MSEQPALSERLLRRIERLLDEARFLGSVAVLMGDCAAAREHYQPGFDWATKIRHRPQIALTRLELAELLLGDAVSDQKSPVSGQMVAAERQRAVGLEHLDFAIKELEAMEMQPGLDRALYWQRSLGK